MFYYTTFFHTKQHLFVNLFLERLNPQNHRKERFKGKMQAFSVYKSKSHSRNCIDYGIFLCKSYKKDIFAILLTGFELNGLSYILFGNSFRYCCESNIRCLFGCQKNRCGNIQTQYNHYQYAFQSRYINSPRNLSTNDQNRN